MTLMCAVTAPGATYRKTLQIYVTGDVIASPNPSKPRPTDSDFWVGFVLNQTWHVRPQTTPSVNYRLSGFD